MSKGARNRARRLAERDAPEKVPVDHGRGRSSGYAEYWRKQARLKMASPGRSGSEKRRARKGGRYQGPGLEGKQGAARRAAGVRERGIGIER